MSKEYLVFTFPSTYHALKAEKALKEKNYKIPLAPIPRELTSNCGEVIRIDPEMKLELKLILEEANVEIEGIHLIKPREKTSLLDKFFGF
ncbi:MAG: DUF3343 domain-containing protein [Halanaerobiales bacterium]|nr:DUF3343 domain-containing protein [Halanaerobiales bacterium]